MEPFTKEEFGWVLYSKVSDYLGKITCPNGEFTEENLKAGNYRFLINEKNEFIANSMEKFT